jgi:uncharacterized membrane protein
LTPALNERILLLVRVEAYLPPKLAMMRATAALVLTFSATCFGAHVAIAGFHQPLHVVPRNRKPIVSSRQAVRLHSSVRSVASPPAPPLNVLERFTKSVNTGAETVSNYVEVGWNKAVSRAAVIGGSTVHQLAHPWVVPTVTAMLAFGVLASYHYKLYKQETSGVSTWRSTQANTRVEWAKHVRDTENWIYATQTLRNAITANAFLATTVLSLLTVITGKIVPMIKDGVGRRTITLQFVFVSFSMLLSAYEFLQSARLMTHAGFMFPVTKNSTKVDSIMRKSQNGQWLGLRWLYLSLGFLSWLVGGGMVFLLSALLLTSFFRQIDRVPSIIDEDTVHVII